MTARWLVVVVAAAACSDETTSRDDVAGVWRSTRPGAHEIELRADGTTDIPVTPDQRCSDDTTALAACQATVRWDRRGNQVRLWPAALVSSGGPGGGSFLGMFDKKSAPPGTPPCVCQVDREPTVLELRDPRTLVSGDEVAIRVR